jgi:predicted nucleic acid-binding protein
MMRVVSNASPLIFLSKLGELELLAHCFAEISIPQAVRAEVGDLSLPTFVQVQTISEFGKHYVAGSIGTLHAGELEAMVLAQETAADFVLLDDLRARQKAKRMGLNMIGTLGVLQLAHAKGLIGRDKLLVHYDELVNQHGMWLSEKMLQQLKSV